MNFARVAFLPDTFHEVNGVAHTSRHFEAFARRRQIPFLSVHAGQTNRMEMDGNVRMLELARGAARIGLDANLDYDPFLLRHGKRVRAAMEEFKPDLIHLTGPGDMGALGWYLSVRLGIPLVISWHTSLHEYAARRLERATRFLGDGTSQALGSVAEGASLRVLRCFYRQAAMVLAPNPELIELTRRLTHKPVFPMPRGVETDLFHPAKRTRQGGAFRMGYVGRLTAEKNVRFLAELCQALKAKGGDFEIVIVGEGNEEAWLRENVPNAIFTGVLRGERLAQAYADMDLFVFPSTTDTFGNVILEALSSGVPCVVTNSGGPKFLVEEGATGHVASNARDFVEFAAGMIEGRWNRARMCEAARAYALKQSWDSVFESVFVAYNSCLRARQAA